MRNDDEDHQIEQLCAQARLHLGKQELQVGSAAFRTACCGIFRLAWQSLLWDDWSNNLCFLGSFI